MGIDRQAGLLLREARCFLGETQVVPKQIEEVGRVGSVENGECGIQSDRMGVKAKHPVRDPVKCSGPIQVARAYICPNRSSCAARLAQDPHGASCHLRGRTAGESQQQDTLGIRSVEDEASDPVGKCLSLARTSARNDQKRSR